MDEDILFELMQSQQSKENNLKYGKTSNEGEKSEKTEDGLVQLENGKVLVKDPIGNGGIPSITPSEGLRLKVNGKTMTDTVFVREQDEIIVEFVDEEIEGGFDVFVSEDKLTASLVLRMSYFIDKRLKAIEPTNSWILEPERLLVKKGWGFSYEDVVKYLNKQGIISGINLGKLQEKFTSEKDDTFVVAEGTPPTESIDEVIEILFPTDDLQFYEIFKDQQKVDFRQSFLVSVSRGDVLAIKHKGRLGRPGTSVTGEFILPREPKQCSLQAGNGTELIDDGFRVVATIDGQPKVESTGQLWKLSVDAQLTHHGDVNHVTGNLKFKGNIKVLGSVIDFSLVEATETVLIIGMVDNSTVFAGKNIEIREKVIASTLRAGGIGAYCSRLLPYLKELKDVFLDMREAVLQLLSSSSTMGLNIDDKNFGQLIFLLKEKKFVYVDKTIEILVDLITKADVQLPDDFLILAETFTNCLLRLNCQKLRTVKEFDSMKDNLELAYSTAKKLKEQKSNITMDYAQNSKVSASGDVYVQGQGCFITVIYSGGSTKINGVFRGGQIYSDGNVFINEAGVEAGTKTEIQVPKDKTISINKVYEDIYIKIGPHRYRFDVPSANVLAKLDERGNLFIKSLPLKND